MRYFDRSSAHEKKNPNDTSLISVQDLSVSYGDVSAISGVSFTVGEGEILGIIGPNGAGKTTLLNTICGVVRATSGEITLRGSSISKKSFPARSRLGLSRTFQTPRGSALLTLDEQLLIQCGGSIKGAQSRSATTTGRISKALERVRLTDQRRNKVASLTLGEWRRFEIARAIVQTPLILLVDEPCSGMTGEESRRLGVLLGEVAAEGISILLIEHNIAFVRSLAPQLLVLDAGVAIASGSTDDVLSMEVVKSAYLGRTAA